MVSSQKIGSPNLRCPPDDYKICNLLEKDGEGELTNQNAVSHPPQLKLEAFK